MNKLLRANFAALWKSKIFWLGVLFSTGMGVLASLSKYREMISIPGRHPHIDHILFSNCLFIPIVAAAFMGLFLGTDYSDGTIRNKLVVGRTRTEVYLSNLIVCTAAIFLIHLANTVTIAAIGFPLVGNVESPVADLVKLSLVSLVTLIALTSVYLLMGMLIHNKAAYCVAALLLSMFFLMSAMIINNKLTQEEYYEAYSFTYTDASGVTHEEHEKRRPNPEYLTGSKRQAYEFLYDFLPGCQMLQIARQELERPERLPPYSFILFGATTGAGLFFFRKKNIK